MKNNLGWGDLRLHPHDMAKLGYLMLRNGKWEDHQIIPEEWIRKSTSMQVDLPDKGPFSTDYGYGWHVMAGTLKGIYQAYGRGGQYIIVWPEKDLVIVYTGGGFDAGMIAQGLLTSVRSDNPLPENFESNSALQNIAEKAAKAPVKEPVKPAEFFNSISQNSWLLEDNTLKFKSFGIDLRDPGNCMITLKSEFFNFEKLPLHFDNLQEISNNGKYKLPMYATAKWMSANELVINVCEIANVNNYTIRLLLNKNDLTFGFIEKSMMKNEILLSGMPQ
jgi:hypothetical protein